MQTQTQTATDLRDALREAGILTFEQSASLAEPPLCDIADPDVFVAELVSRGWLTRFQAQATLNGHAARLRLGNYVLIDRLGRGGMGEVFRARQLKLKRIVAVKVIHPDCLKKAGAAERFRRESQAAARLAHPNVVRLFDSDSASGLLYMAMEFVEGADLGRVVKAQGPLDIARACELIRQAALGLQHAHEQGLVHRDIKPGNLFVTIENNHEVVKLLDFGLARFTSENGGDLDHLTETGTVIGTPEFLSPEQARDSRTADIRADVFSLGCTLYYLLTADVPFPGNNVLEKLLARVNGAYTPAWMKRPDVPAELEAVIARSLAPNPEHRYQVPADLADALTPFAHGLAAPAIPLAEAALEEDEVTEASQRSAVFDFERTVEQSVDRSATQSVRTTPVPRAVWWGVGVVAALLLLTGLVALAMWVFSGNGRTPGPIASGPEETSPTKTTTGEVRAWTIADDERGPWQLPELLGVVGSQRGRSWLPVLSMATTSDRKSTVTVSVSGDWPANLHTAETTCCLWDGELRLKRVWRVSPPITDYAPVLSPDGRWVYLHGFPGINGRLYDLKADPPRLAEGLPSAHLVFGGFPDANTLITTGTHGLTQYWNLKTWPISEGPKIPPQPNQPAFVAMTPDGQTLLAYSVTMGAEPLTGLRLLRVTPTHLTEQALVPPAKRANFGQIALSADGRSAASIVYTHPEVPGKLGTNRLQVWEVGTPEPATLEPTPSAPNGMALSPTGNQLLVRDGSDVRVWEKTAGKWKELPERLHGQSALGRPTVAFHTGGFLRATADQTIEFCEVREGHVRGSGSPGQLTGLAWSPDGGRLFILRRWLGGRSQIQTLSADTGEPTGASAEGPWYVERLQLAGESRLLYASGSSATRWNDAPDAAERLQAFDLALHPKPVPAVRQTVGLAVGRSAMPLVTLDERGNMPIWGSVGGPPNGFKQDAVLGVAMSGDGRLLLTGGGERVRVFGIPGKGPRFYEGGLLQLWDVSGDGGVPKISERRKSRGLTQPIQCVDLSADGTLAASGGRDAREGLVKVWETDGWQERSGFVVRHEGTVLSVAFSPDGRYLASSGQDGRVILTASATLREVKSWQFLGPVTDLVFDPRGRRLATVNGNGTAFVVRMPE